MAHFDQLQRLSDTVWEIPVSCKEGMQVPARIYGTEQIVRETDDAVYDQVMLEQPPSRSVSAWTLKSLNRSWTTPARNDLTIYDALAESWWQAGSQLHLLARMNPARFAYFDPIVQDWRGLRVLDLGCGGGLATSSLTQRGATVVGLDLSRASLQVAARHHGEVVPATPGFACGRAEALPLADASFDVVWCTDVLEHLPDVSVAIAQVARVLKPDGFFLYDTLNRTWLSHLLAIGFWEYLAGLAPRGTHDWRLFITPPELSRLLTHYGLQPRGIHGMLPVWVSPRQGWRFRLTRYTGILYLGYATKCARHGPESLSPVSPLPQKKA